ncbi:MAG: FAD-dependent oxidoreductase [Rhodospirillaceae bacterium]|nr:FAD-dependent oxidoreductase [Rhodospirillaceae bacterium]MBT6139786.1 FAD-dependent oxidoreductase [Rhodospirillaceae bacterium]
MKEILIVGGGFAGLWAALAAAREIAEAGAEAEIAVRVVSRDRFLTNRPRLYEASSDGYRVPLEPTLGPVGVALDEAEVTAIDTSAHEVSIQKPDGTKVKLPYDRLIMAAGSIGTLPPIEGLDQHAFSIDDYAAAMALDRHLEALVAKPGSDTFVILGSGFTGIELATELRNRIAATADPEAAERARVVLVEQADRVAPELGDNPRSLIEDALVQSGVEVRLRETVERVEADNIVLGSGERIASCTLIVTVGPRASPLNEAFGVALDPSGRAPCDDMLRVIGVPDTYMAGDVAMAHVDDEHVALMSCQHAITMGKFAGFNAARDLLGLALRPYRQIRYVTCLDLGRGGAVFTTGWDREVQMHGDEAKQLKRTIVSERIIPPTGEREAILAAAALDG